MFKQLFDPETFTYTYLLADDASRDAVLIDPVREQGRRDLDLLKRHGLTLRYVLETHVHADHITGARSLKQATGAQSAVGAACGASGFDRPLNDGDEIRFGGETIRAIATPGHTPGSMSYLWRDRLFSGDTLLIGGCGRTDFQGGDAHVLYRSITAKLFSLPDETLVYPGHDYQGRWVSSIAEERAGNSRLSGKSEAEFVQIMQNLHLPKPKRMDESLPVNLQGGG